jgi:hypothetical protein
LTLRDYLNLKNLISKAKEPEASSPLSPRKKYSEGPGTPLSPLSPRSGTSSRIRKAYSSNSEVMAKIRQ